jgi:polyhydroxyalkanoate synthesis regulator phasin
MESRPRVAEPEPVIRPPRRNSWGAIFAGALIVLTVQLLLGVLGLAIGLTAVNPATEQDPWSGIGIGAMIWWIVTGIVALLVGGWAGGRMAGLPRRLDGALHGAIVWALSTVLMVWLAFSAAGAVVGGAWNVLSTTAQAAGGIASSAAGAIPGQIGADDIAWQEIQREIRQMMQSRGIPIEEEAPSGYREIEDALYELLREDPAKIGEISEQDKQAIVDVVVRRTELTQEEARQRVDKWVRQYEQAVEDAREFVEEELPRKAEKYGGQAADAAAKAAWWIFLMLLLGLVAAVVGGAVGAPVKLDRWER